MGAIENKRMWEGVGERFGLVSIKMRRSAGFLPYIIRTTEPSILRLRTLMTSLKCHAIRKAATTHKSRKNSPSVQTKYSIRIDASMITLRAPIGTAHCTKRAAAHRLKTRCTQLRPLALFAASTLRAPVHGRMFGRVHTRRIDQCAKKHLQPVEERQLLRSRFNRVY